MNWESWTPWLICLAFALLAKATTDHNQMLSHRVKTEEASHQCTRFVLQQLVARLAAQAIAVHQEFCELDPARIRENAEQRLGELESVLKEGRKTELARFVRSHFAATWDDAHSFVRRWKETPRDQKLLLVEAAVWNESVTKLKSQAV